MNYFQAYLPSLDEAIVAAWDSQIAEASETPWLAQALAAKSAELFPRFASSYTRLRAMPRATRRALQRRLALSGDFAIPMEWRRRFAGSLAGAALLLALGQQAQAAIINVTTNDPRIKADGLCSLIEAIVNANADAATHGDCTAGSGADEIVLPPASVHTLTKSVASATGLPEITTPITISGNGATIERKRTAPRFRIFAVDATGDLTLKDLTVSRGGRLSLNGGGIFNQGVLTIRNSTISDNRGRLGGGVYSYDGNLTIEDSVVTGNRSKRMGGGLFSQGGSVSVDNCLVAKNSAASGGGIEAFDYVTLAISNSTISRNRSRQHGGGLSLGAGDFTLEKSTISHNKAGSSGGGISILSGGSLTVENSTLSGNVSRKESGGGLFNGGGTVILSNSTISRNKAKSGGGVHNLNDLTLNRSLVSGNKADTGREIVSSGSASVSAANYNIFGVSNNAGVVGFTYSGSDIVPSVPLASIIDLLANNGGVTYTRALPTGSPAIDAVPSTDPACTGTDQRGVTRPQGADCDIGAFEKQ